MRVQTNDTRLEVHVSPLEREHLAWNPPSGDVGELHGWPDCRWQEIQHAFQLLAFEEARPHVSFLEHRDVRHLDQLPVLTRQVEDSLQRRQLAVDLAVRDLPLGSFVAFAGGNHVSLTLQDERVDVWRCDRRQAPSAEVRGQVQSDPPLQFVGGASSVHRVLRLQIVRRLVEPDSIQLRIHWQAVLDVALSELQQLLGCRLLRAVRRLAHADAVLVVLDPPDGAAFVQRSHARSLSIDNRCSSVASAEALRWSPLNGTHDPHARVHSQLRSTR